MYKLEEDIYNVGDRTVYSRMNREEKELCRKFCVVEYMGSIRIVSRLDLSFDRDKQVFFWRGKELPECFHIQLKEQLHILLQMPDESDPPCSLRKENYTYQYFVIRNFMGICKVLKK